LASLSTQSRNSALGTEVKVDGESATASQKNPISVTKTDP
jgi:hypothetical protein